MKKALSIIITLVISLSSVFPTFALTDEKILTDPITNMYTGRTEAQTIIKNINFKDVPATFWAREAITRSGALNMVKGFNNNYNPSGTVSKEEAIAFLMRGVGLEIASQQAGITAMAAAPGQTGLQNIWSLGYLNMASQIGVITPAEYTEALTATPVNFIRTAPATREEVADWLVKAITYKDPQSFISSETQQKVYTFTDWKQIDVTKVSAVESISTNKIMTGTNGLFKPKGNISRAEMAQVLKNMDSIYFKAMGIEKKIGTVGVLKDAQQNQTGSASAWRNIYIRTDAGTIDAIQYELQSSSSPQAKNKDAVVYLNGAGTIGGLNLLEEGQQIEYLVDTATSTVLYVQMVKGVSEYTLQRLLYSFDITDGQIITKDDTGKQFTYPVVKGLYGTNGTKSYLVIDQKDRDMKSLPIGSRVELTILNDVVKEIKFIGQKEIYPEIRGIVVENNSELGYITIIDNTGAEVTKKYYSDDMVVEKQPYYTEQDDIGYLNQMFPHFQYDPRSTVISEVEPGDIVFILPDSEDPEAITSISASTNYIMKYGKIKQFKANGNEGQVLIEYEDKSTAWFDVPDGIFVSEDGKPKKVSDIQAGDWAKLLVNQAIIEPGHVMQSVKEITLEGSEHFISNIVKGQLNSINPIQNQLILQNVQTLSKTGWSNYTQLKQFSLSGKDVEYYYQGKRISLDYANKFLKRSDGDVYVGLENSYATERVKIVTFRQGRDELLPSDTVLDANGSGAFSIITNSGDIKTDQGTIVRRYGRLVDGNSIMPSDYARVALNGENNAAVVDITDMPDISGVVISRGRIATINDDTSFKIQSMATLAGTSWAFSPIQREFTIDYDTKYLDSTGLTDPKKFITYTTDTKVDKVYNIVVDGTKATYVVDSPYTTKSVKGTIYDITDTTVSIKDAYVYNETTGKWTLVSNTNSTLVITVPTNSIIVKNNKVVTTSGLVKGDSIRVMTDKLDAKVLPATNITGYIILNEK